MEEETERGFWIKGTVLLLLEVLLRRWRRPGTGWSRVPYWDSATTDTLLSRKLRIVPLNTNADAGSCDSGVNKSIEVSRAALSQHPVTFDLIQSLPLQRLTGCGSRRWAGLRPGRL